MAEGLIFFNTACRSTSVATRMPTIGWEIRSSPTGHIVVCRRRTEFLWACPRTNWVRAICHALPRLPLRKDDEAPVSAKLLLRTATAIPSVFAAKGRARSNLGFPDWAEVERPIVLTPAIVHADTVTYSSQFLSQPSKGTVRASNRPAGRPVTAPANGSSNRRSHSPAEPTLQGLARFQTIPNGPGEVEGFLRVTHILQGQ